MGTAIVATLMASRTPNSSTGEGPARSAQVGGMTGGFWFGLALAVVVLACCSGCRTGPPPLYEANHPMNPQRRQPMREAHALLLTFRRAHAAELATAVRRNLMVRRATNDSRSVTASGTSTSSPYPSAKRGLTAR